MAIYYNILYPPLVPITHPAFELLSSRDTFRIYMEPSVGNRISDFRGGFIRIRNAETERNLLSPIEGLYLDDFLPFRNPFAEKIDLTNPNKNIEQPKGYSTLPVLRRTEDGNYYLELSQSLFFDYEAKKDIRYKLQIMLTTDWVSSSDADGKGHIQVWQPDENKYVTIDKNLYFNGNLVSKGLSEWSTNTLIAPVSEAKYELQLDGNNIYSPIFEFVGSSIEDNIRNNSLSNYLKAYRINIYRAFGDEREFLVDTSSWVIGQESTNLQIRWQNIVELEDKTKYIIELDIQTIWDLRKTFVYHVSTQFESSLFWGNVTVTNDHENARNKINLNIKTPLQWGPRENFSISSRNADFATITGEAHVLEGIDLFNKNGSISGEMIVGNITPIHSWQPKEDRWFMRIAGPAISTVLPYQEEYLLYAYSAPIGKDKEDNSAPYVDDIIINPVIEDAEGNAYKTYLDSSKIPTIPGYPNSGEIGAVVTMKAGDPSSHSFFYLEDELKRMWRLTVTNKGEFTGLLSHDKDESEFLKPICMWDPITATLVELNITSDGEIKYKEIATNYKIENNARPMYINEFVLEKRLYGLELGRKTLIMKQKYKAYMTNYNRKLDKWNKIEDFRNYYIYFSSDKTLEIIIFILVQITDNSDL